MDANKIHLAEAIDTWVLSVLNQRGGDEQLLEGMHTCMDAFKQLLDTCTRLEMTLLAQRYDGFYRFASLLARLAQAIADGGIEVPQDGPLPDNQDKPKKPRVLKGKPTLIAWGMKDIAFREKELKRWESAFPAARTVCLTSMGHFVQEEAPDQLAATAVPFLKATMLA